MKTVFETLQEYCASDAYPFHMPGHKRNKKLIQEMYGDYGMGSGYAIDITEIDGMDNLHHAQGILLDAQKRAARIYGADQSFFLINGSTCGLLAAVYACTEQHGAILMARNCHKAVYHAAELRELQKFYLYPEDTTADEVQQTGRSLHLNGRILPASVEEGLCLHPEITAVLITSPTYDGMVSDVKEIAQIVHKYGKVLIVDEAHGAHYGFTDHFFFPENALKLGADIVVHSLHKTLPSFTQTALLSVAKRTDDLHNPGQRCGLYVDKERVRKYLGMFETSSPSYVMMAGIDQCLAYVERNQESLFGTLQHLLSDFYTFAEGLSHVHVVRKPYQDLSKILIFADGIGGFELAEILRRDYHLEVEMAAPGYVLALTSIFDTKEGFERLKQALADMENRSVAAAERTGIFSENDQDQEMQQDMICSKKKKQHTDPGVVPVDEAVGRISGEYVYLYPPGIPLLVPGEVITEEIVDEMNRVKKLGFELQGMQDYTGETIRIIDIKE